MENGNWPILMAQRYITKHTKNMVFSLYNFIPGCINSPYKALSYLFHWSQNKILHIT